MPVDKTKEDAMYKISVKDAYLKIIDTLCLQCKYETIPLKPYNTDKPCMNESIADKFNAEIPFDR
jgi:hypothetical protein